MAENLNQIIAAQRANIAAMDDATLIEEVCFARGFAMRDPIGRAWEQELEAEVVRRDLEVW